MVAFCKRLAESARFQQFVTGVIIFAGILVGMETNAQLHEAYAGPMHVLNEAVLAIFTLEIGVKMIGEGSKPWRFFRDPWNCFDFVVVAASFMPLGGGQAIVVLRLVRLLRVLRLVRAVPKLQLLVSALLKSIPSMAYVSVLLFLLFYVYGVAAVFLFGHNDPIHFGSLQISVLSLFRTVTLEDWTDIMYIQMYGCAGYGYGGSEHLCTASEASPILGALFFVSFVLIGTMIVLNLFIGVIMNGMSEAQTEAENERKDAARLAQGTAAPALDEELATIGEQIATLQKALAQAQRRAKTLSDSTQVSGVHEPVLSASAE
jgi:voltage-gated sodium channel